MAQQETELASIKKPGEKEIISKEEYTRRIRELAKCKRDIIYFANNHFKIVSLDKGLINISLYPKQEELLRCFVDNDRVVTVASRQVGKTTTYTVFTLWLAMFFSEKRIMVCANKLQTAIEVMDRIRLAYEYLPKWIKPAITVYNK